MPTTRHSGFAEPNKPQGGPEGGGDFRSAVPELTIDTPPEQAPAASQEVQSASVPAPEDAPEDAPETPATQDQIVQAAPAALEKPITPTADVETNVLPVVVQEKKPGRLKRIGAKLKSLFIADDNAIAKAKEKNLDNEGQPLVIVGPNLSADQYSGVPVDEKQDAIKGAASINGVVPSERRKAASGDPAWQVQQQTPLADQQDPQDKIAA